MGVQAAGCSLSARAAQHTHLLQHKVLHAQDARGTPAPLLLTHHEALEEDQRARHQDPRPERLPQILRPRQHRWVVVIFDCISLLYDLSIYIFGVGQFFRV